MTDRELLELAAKAAGIDWFDEPAAKSGRGLHLKSGPFWNPLTDDGDAMRLAVKLNLLNATRFADSITVRDIYGRQYEEVSHDLYAATRRAIVRAAAEIGRGME